MRYLFSIKKMAYVIDMGLLKYRNLDQKEQDYIFEAVIEDKSMRQICLDLNISLAEFSNFVYTDPLFSKRMQKAREMWAHNKVYDLSHITDSCITMAEVQNAKVASENIKWSAGKFVPNVYGENINVNVNHSLDLSSILLAAENRVIPVLQNRMALESNTIDLEPTVEHALVSTTEQSTPVSNRSDGISKDFDDLI